jgi:hypothetical protein
MLACFKPALRNLGAILIFALFLVSDAVALAL